MIRISSLIIGLMLSSIIAASGQESQPSQPPSPKAQSEAACRSKCEAQYADYKECAEESLRCTVLATCTMNACTIATDHVAAMAGSACFADRRRFELRRRRRRSFPCAFKPRHSAASRT